MAAAVAAKCPRALPPGTAALLGTIPYVPVGSFERAERCSLLQSHGARAPSGTSMPIAFASRAPLTSQRPQ